MKFHPMVVHNIISCPERELEVGARTEKEGELRKRLDKIYLNTMYGLFCGNKKYYCKGMLINRKSKPMRHRKNKPRTIYEFFPPENLSLKYTWECMLYNEKCKRSIIQFVINCLQDFISSVDVIYMILHYSLSDTKVDKKFDSQENVFDKQRIKCCVCRLDYFTISLNRDDHMENCVNKSITKDLLKLLT